MANPSLQIGNDNWAIKEDDLLGYSKAGTRFVPEPITMTRASAGTRVNPEGLVKTVGSLGSELVTNGDFSEIGSEEVTNGDFSEIGPELVTNGDFSSASGWSGSQSISAGQLTKTAGGLAYQNSVVTAGKAYKIVVDVESLDGTTQVYVGGANSVLSVGVQTVYITAGSSNAFIGFNNGYSTGVGSVINSISVKEVGQDWSFAGLATMGDEVVSFVDNGTNTNSSIAQSVLTTSKSYKLVFEITRYVAGRIQILSGGGTYTVDISGGIGVYTTPIQSGGSTTFTIKRDGGYPNFDFDIDNVSVKEVGQDWSLGTGWSVENNQLVSVAGTAAYTTQVSVGEIGKTYQVTVDVDEVSAGTTYAYTGVGGTWYTITSPGVYTFYVVWDSATSLGIYKNSTFAGKWNSISVKEATVFDLARVDYTDGTSSLLAEPQRTNLVTNSESISNLSSTTNGTGTLTITDNYTDSPQGLQNASRVQMSIVDTNDTNNYRLINTGSVMITGVTREISFYAKSLTGSNQDVLVYWSYDQQIVTLTNDWQRFKISATSGNSGSVFIGTRGGTTQYYAGGDANLDFALWGLQVEDDGSGGGSSYATSYIPTYGTTVTRLKDQYEKTGISDLINSEEGVLFVEMAALSNDSTFRTISINNGTNETKVQIAYYTASQTVEALVKVSNVRTYDYSYVLTDITDINKLAIKYKQDDFAFWVNGTEVDTSVSGNVPTGLNVLSFDNGNSGSPLYAKVKQLQVYKEALSDDELTILTGTSGVHFYPSYAAMASVLTYKIE